MIRKHKEIFKWRQLLFSLALKDLKKKYRNATGGVGWMLILPFAQAVIFSFIFKFLFKVEVDNYPLFLLSGLFPWVFLRSSLDAAKDSILNNANLIKKSYFPRQVLPISNIVSNFINFLFALVILLLFSVFYAKVRLSALWSLPLLILIQLVMMCGISLLVSSLNTIFRETEFLMDILFLVWFYITPIVYPLQMLKNILHPAILRLYALNPMVGIISGYQEIFVYGNRPDMGLLSISFFFSLLIFFFGWAVFSRCEQVFADLI
ncbi:MAG: ABC transporter permease [Candidatus Omnitrophota bacterium]